MARDFERGDQVTVTMARNSVFPWQTGPRFEAEYVRGPQGPGDVFVVLLEDGTRLSLNGNSSEFVGIHGVPREDPNPDVPF